LSLAWARPCLAGAGAEPFDFLFLDANARPVGLGGAYTALATDANALLYNPAGLAQVSRHEATFMHNAHMQGINQEYAAYASPHGWSASLNYLRFGDVQKTTLSNPDGQGLGQTTLSDLALGAGYGLKLEDSLALGLGLKYIREVIAGLEVTGYGMDAGALYSVPMVLGLDLGLALQNIGPTTRSRGAHENLPLNLRAGAAYSFYVRGHENVIALDVSKERSQGALAAVGAETRVLELLALRLGFNTRNDAGVGITAGFGCLFKDGSIDYAFVPMGDLGDAHRISATLRWDAGGLRGSKPLRP
jgi:hypothetical protein